MTLRQAIDYLLYDPGAPPETDGLPGADGVRVRTLARAIWAVVGWREVATDPPPDGEHLLALLPCDDMVIMYRSDDDWYTPDGDYFDGDAPYLWHPLPPLPEVSDE